MSSAKRTFVVYVEDKPGVLNRVASLFRRRAYNIESLSVGHTHEPGVSRMTIVMKADEVVARLVEANLYKLVNVLRVEDVTDSATVVRDLALVKVRAEGGQRAQVLQLVEVFRARVIDMATDALIIEITGTEDKVDGMLEVLQPFGIIELVRAGSVAMTRGSRAPSIHPDFVPAQVKENGGTVISGNPQPAPVPVAANRR
jgi:acetolactate synthase-1/3 small subunit